MAHDTEVEAPSLLLLATEAPCVHTSFRHLRRVRGPGIRKDVGVRLLWGLVGGRGYVGPGLYNCVQSQSPKTPNPKPEALN